MPTVQHEVIAAEVTECATWHDVQAMLHSHDSPVHALAKGETAVTYWERNQVIAVLKTKTGFLAVRVRYEKVPGGVEEPVPAQVPAKQPE